jgi:hypothetical protein
LKTLEIVISETTEHSIVLTAPVHYLQNVIQAQLILNDIRNRVNTLISVKHHDHLTKQSTTNAPSAIEPQTQAQTVTVSIVTASQVLM